jgi:hypothetical protein
LEALRDAKTVKHWTFPPPPRIGHIKDIVVDGDRLWVGVEIGSLQFSDDFGKSFTELPVDPDPRECDRVTGRELQAASRRTGEE